RRPGVLEAHPIRDTFERTLHRESEVSRDEDPITNGAEDAILERLPPDAEAARAHVGAAVAMPCAAVDFRPAHRVEAPAALRAREEAAEEILRTPVLRVGREEAAARAALIGRPLAGADRADALPKLGRHDLPRRRGLADPLSLGALESPALPGVVILHPLGAVPDVLTAIDR